MAKLTGPTQSFDIDTLTVDSSEETTLGTRAWDLDGNEYIYLQGTASIIARDWVVYDENHSTTRLAANEVGPVAIAATAVGLGEYGWFQIYGKAQGNSDDIAADKSLYVDGTAGRVDDLSVSGDLVIGAYSMTASSSNVATVYITYPHVSDDIGGSSITGPGSSNDNAIARWDGTGGNALQDSSVYIDDSGNVGIGTGTPTANLHIIGTAYIDGTVEVTEDLKTKVFIVTPGASQTLTGSTDIINANTNTHYDVMTSGDDLVMSGTPIIPDGVEGQVLFLHNKGTTTITLQDKSSLTGSNIILGSADATVRPDAVTSLLFDSSAGGWVVTSNPNTSVAGANASTIPVRNTSGSTIAVGKVVYATGFNVGLNRVTVDLADANDPTKMPAIGITASSIGNNSNGDVIVSGNAIGLINTSGASVGDGVWVGTTAGEVVFTRPSVDAIQKIGEVTRSNASGNILVVGAGRSNDVPIEFSAGTVHVDNLHVVGASGTARITSELLSADRVIYVPDAAGTVIVSGDAHSGSAMLVSDGSSWRVFGTADIANFIGPHVKSVGVEIYDPSTSMSAGTAKVFFTIPEELNTWIPSGAHAEVYGTAASTAVVIDANHNGVSMFSTKLFIDPAEQGSDTSATAVVLYGTAVATNDRIEWDIDTANTATKGLFVRLRFDRP